MGSDDVLHIPVKVPAFDEGIVFRCPRRIDVWVCVGFVFPVYVRLNPANRPGIDFLHMNHGIGHGGHLHTLLERKRPPGGRSLCSKV